MDRPNLPDAWPTMTSHDLRKPLLVSLILILSACGGGGSSDSGSTPANQTPNIPVPGTGEINIPDDGEVTEPPPENDDLNNPIVDVSDPNQCNSATQNQWAYDSMRDFYLFYDQVPVVDPQSFESANDLVRNVRFQERDDFSHVSDAQQSSLQFDEGREFGLGYGWRFDNEGNARIVGTVLDSPFGRAGIERGDIILSVDGLDWSDETLDVNFGERVFGTPDDPATATWSFQKRDSGQVVTFDLTATEYDINTVVALNAFTNSAFSGSIGYLAFSRFLNTSESELNQAFEFLQNQNITELVLDLRYNGGGRVSIARQLTSLLGGDSLAGETIYEYRFNDQYTDSNFILDFQSNVGDLGLSRVVVLTSRNTASASEIVISGLQPHIEVVTIGGATRGKPYIQFAYDRCGERLALIEAEGFNASGVSVFGGIPAVCYGEDDPTMDFGLSADSSQFEGLLQAGVDYITTGACAVEPVTIASRSSLNQAAVDAQNNYRQGISADKGGALAD